uniref:Uncharacterized protein n=1 Tax=Anopheles christyi TaxID=43041 RepID=A0A182K4Z8_9DIPT
MTWDTNSRSSNFPAPVKQFIILKFHSQTMVYNITFYQHPSFIDNHHQNPPPFETTPKDTEVQHDIALIELERTVSLSICQFVCLWTWEIGENDTLPHSFFTQTVNISSIDESLTRPEVTTPKYLNEQSKTSQKSRCVIDWLMPTIMQPEPDDDRL